MGDGGRPGGWAEEEGGAGGVLGVADAYAGGQAGDLDAVLADVTEGRLDPGDLDAVLAGVTVRRLDPGDSTQFWPPESL